MSQAIRVCALLLLLFPWLPFESARAESLELGKLVFLGKAEPPCALCHTLKAAGSTGEIGPNLDDLKPDEERVSNAVKNGVGTMPPYDEILSEAEIAAVASYVAEAVLRENGR